MTKPIVHVLVACTNRKRSRPTAKLRLRSVRRAAGSRAGCWVDRIEAATRDVAAADLYAGDGWFVARRLAAGLEDSAQLWALSAGFGLVRSDEPIAAYDATLSSGHPDSVYRPGDRPGPRTMRRRWWQELCEWDGSSGMRPRSVAALAGDGPSNAVVVCAGSDYIDATTDDLVQAQRLLETPERLVILGAGQCPDDGLKSSWVPLPSKLRTVVGGSLGSLSVRSAERVLQDVGPGVTAELARRQVDRMCSGIEDLPLIERKRMSDDAVAEWIALAFGDDATLTKTVALRRLRDSGLACEQRRFGQLFSEVQDALT